MFSDAPVRYKSNSNLVRSIPSPSMSKENSRNSLSSHLGRHKHQRARSGKFRDNRIRPSSRHDRNRRRQRRRNRKRCQLDPSECKDADKNSSNKADNNSKKKKKDNIDLVRSLDRRSSVKEAKERSKRREKEKKKKRRERKLRRRERKREKKRQKRLRKARREERKRQRLAAALKAEEEEKGLRQKRHLRVRSVVEESKTKPSSGSGAKKCRAATKDITSATSAGNHQYIDSCSWPHCNPTCPKLKNPETGKSEI